MRIAIIALLSFSMCGCCLLRPHHVSEEDLIAINEQLEQEIVRLHEQNDQLRLDIAHLSEDLAEKDALIRSLRQGEE